MTETMLFLVLGFGAGAIYGILALGLVLKYRAAGVVDFAHGAVAMMCAFQFVSLRDDGDFTFPWPVLPHTLHISDTGVPLPTSIAWTLIFSALLGALLYYVVYRPLQRSTPLTKVCASVGVMLYLQATAVLNYGTSGRSTAPVLPSSTITIAGVPIPTDRLWLSALVVLLALVLAYVYRRTLFGLRTRAGAESDVGSAVMGLSSTRIAMQNWILATVLAGVSGILLSPISNLDPTSYTLFIVPALCVALLAGFRSFIGTALAGLALGMAQSQIVHILSSHQNLPQQGISEGIPFLVILVIMTWRGRSLIPRGELADPDYPKVGRPSAPFKTALLTLIAGSVVLMLLHGSLKAAFMTSIIWTCLALSLVVLTGFVGQVSLAQLSFAGFSGFIVARVSADLGINFPLSLLIASVAAVPLGLLIGLPALRVRGVNLAIVTLAAGSALDVLLFNNAKFSGGDSGLTVPTPTFMGFNLGIASGPDYPRTIFGVLILAIVIGVGVVVARLRNSSTGRMLLAVRSNERAAAASGINVPRAKLLAFGISSFIAGLGGVLLAYQQGSVSASSFGVFQSLGLLAIAYVAGIGRISGAVVAGLLLSGAGLMVSAFDKYLGLGIYQAVIAGIALTLTAIQNPNGIATPIPSGKSPANALERWGHWLVGRGGHTAVAGESQPVTSRQDAA
ncbi:ABC transporter permease [Angustibacter luteus]|uniref:ABC transporter permease n=1 Tax=Angustibacter luteus TaxID=658456 RepID=A0ABW1JE84_9ACTN